MPIIPHSDYSPPIFWKNSHLQTIYPNLYRPLPKLSFIRQKIDTPDQDFLALDWSFASEGRDIGAATRQDKLAILCHGLEGSSSSPHAIAMAHSLQKLGWDVLAWNYRGCGGETNIQLRSYHSGSTDDLSTVVSHVLGTCSYQEIALIGFSLGGNLILKYLGEEGSKVSSRISSAVCFSVPCDLQDCALTLARSSRKVYMKAFLKDLEGKLRAKKVRWPNEIDLSGYHLLKSFKEYDDRYTAPLHGFADAHDYWRRCSAKQYIPGIRVPTLLVNAQDDPFFTSRSFPIEEARDSRYLYLETPAFGGHIGFISAGGTLGRRKHRQYWSERRALEFIQAPAWQVIRQPVASAAFVNGYAVTLQDIR